LLAIIEKGGRDTHKFLSSEDLRNKAVMRTLITKKPRTWTHIDGDEMDFCMAMLAGLGGRHVNDLARPRFDHDMASEQGTIDGKSEKGKYKAW
jgi:hypothetical protein